MKTINKSFEYAFPYYTIDVFGKKKYAHRVFLKMYLSFNEAIHLKFSYESNKIKNIEIFKKKDEKKYICPGKDEKYISYQEFSEYAFYFEKLFFKVLRTLSKDLNYHKSLFFSSVLKFNENMKIECSYDEIKLDFSKNDFKIENEKRVKIEQKKEELHNDEESLLNNVDKFLDVVNDKTSYKEISNEDFNKFVAYRWDDLVPYLEEPKFLRKKEYKL